MIYTSDSKFKTIMAALELPAWHQADILKRADVNRKTLSRHVKLLKEEGLVIEIQDDLYQFDPKTREKILKSLESMNVTLEQAKEIIRLFLEVTALVV